MKAVKEPPDSDDTPKYLTLYGRTKWKKWLFCGFIKNVQPATQL